MLIVQLYILLNPNYHNLNIKFLSNLCFFLPTNQIQLIAFAKYGITVIVGNFCQILNYMGMYEKLNTQVNNSQTIYSYDKRILTHNLYRTGPGSKTATTCASNRPRMLRTCQWLPASIIFCPCFQLRTNQRNPNMLWNQSHRMPANPQHASLLPMARASNQGTLKSTHSPL